MLKIHQLFIIKFLSLFVGTVFVTSFISYITLKSILIQHNKNHLQNTLVIMELDLDDKHNLDLYASNIKSKTNLRVTIVDDKGIVIAESDIKKSKMENHINRYEIIQASNEEFSHVVRMSKTLNIDYLYVAKKLKYKKQDIYIRLSISFTQLMGDFYSLWYKLVALFAIVILIAFYTSNKLSQRVVHDIDEITNFLDDISNKKYHAIIKPQYFYEFLQISLMLKNLVKKLNTRDKQKRKHTAKLRLMNRQRNDILSAISHEFKNPIASIVGYAQTIHDDSTIDKKTTKKFLKKIESNAQKISKMLDRLALSVKLENNDLDMRINRFDMELLCEDVVSNLSSKYKNRNIILKSSKMMVYADKTMIELAIINLIDNALKYSQKDVKVILKDEVFSVKDDGIGIKEEHLDKISSKFYRVKKNSWDNSMGIGLAMVSYILSKHKSELDISSQPNKGSLFSFSLSEIKK